MIQTQKLVTCDECGATRLYFARDGVSGAVLPEDWTMRVRQPRDAMLPLAALAHHLCPNCSTENRSSKESSK